MRKFILLAAVAFIVISACTSVSLPLRIATGALAVALFADVIYTVWRWHHGRN